MIYMYAHGYGRWFTPNPDVVTMENVFKSFDRDIDTDNLIYVGF
jgi:hypothetical protein